MKLCVLLLMVASLGCAPKRAGFPKGQNVFTIHQAEWPECHVMGNRVSCRCSTFDMMLGADGSTVMKCAQ